MHYNLFHRLSPTPLLFADPQSLRISIAVSIPAAPGIPEFAILSGLASAQNNAAGDAAWNV